MTNKDIIRKFIENLVSNHDEAGETFAENIRSEWPGSGMQPVVGKDKLLKFFTDNGHSELISQELDDIIAEGDRVFATGSMISERKGKKSKAHFADFYTLADGKITNIKSFVTVEK